MTPRLSPLGGDYCTSNLHLRSIACSYPDVGGEIPRVDKTCLHEVDDEGTHTKASNYTSTDETLRFWKPLYATTET